MYTDRRRVVVSGLIAIVLLSGCELVPAPPPDQGSASSPGSRQTAERVSGGAVDPAVVARLKGAMVPLLQHMDHPIPTSQVRVGILDDPQINAANGGGGDFYVTL